MFDRNQWKKEIERALSNSPIALLLGPRQCGKTTLARCFVPEDSDSYFDLEDPLSIERLEEPMTALGSLNGLIVIDEIQLRADLFPVLRVLVDRDSFQGRFLILGSASGKLLRQASESLAGRHEELELRGFGLQELNFAENEKNWLRGGMPKSYLAKDIEGSFSWRKSFIRTLLTRDYPQWGVRVSAIALQRFFSMSAHYHGQIWNGAAFARALGVSESSARRYLDLMSETFMIRQLQPWQANISKRQVKSPKIYFRDSGLLHQLLGIRSQRELLLHPKMGASWEGYVIEEILAIERPDGAYFWATHQGAEIDLVLEKNGRLLGVECKRVDAPKITRSMRTVLNDLKLDSIAVVYPGIKRFSLGDRIEAVPLQDVAKGKLFQG